MSAFDLPGRAHRDGPAANPLFAGDLFTQNGGNPASVVRRPRRPPPAGPAAGARRSCWRTCTPSTWRCTTTRSATSSTLGHVRTVAAPDLYDLDGDGDVGETVPVAGDYHADRLIPRNPGGGPALDADGDGVPSLDLSGDGNPDPHPFGNRFDTWHPDMTLLGVGYVADGSGSKAVAVERPYPPPYRPIRNPLGGDVGRARPGLRRQPHRRGPVVQRHRPAVRAERAHRRRRPPRRAALPVTTESIYNALGGNDDVFLDPTTPYFKAPGRESDDDDGQAFGTISGTNQTGDLSASFTTVSDFAEGVNGAGDPRLFPDPNEYGAYGSDDEKPLRAVRITVRYYDVQSDRMREESFRHSLLD